MPVPTASSREEPAARPVDPMTGGRRWRAARETSLAEPYGWLSVVALHWLDRAPQRLPGVPGEWSSDDSSVRVRVTAPDAAVDAETRLALDGTTTFEAGEGASRIVMLCGGEDNTRLALEVIRRTGRAGVRVRDSRAPALTGFSGVPTFDHDVSWAISSPVRWASRATTVVVGAAQPGLEHHVQVVGEVDVVHHGAVTTLKITGDREHPALVFSDTSTGTAPWRILHLEAGDQLDGGRLLLDLNRTVNLPFAFSAFGTCPRPVEGNHLPFPVTAGEKTPRT